MPDDASPEPTPDCGVALRELYGFLDGELTAARVSVIRSHLDHCGGCLEAFDFEAELRAAVATCCRGDAVPEGLRSKVLAAIEEGDGHP